MTFEDLRVANCLKYEDYCLFRDFVELSFKPVNKRSDFEVKAFKELGDLIFNDPDKLSMYRQYEKYFKSIANKKNEGFINILKRK